MRIMTTFTYPRSNALPMGLSCRSAIRPFALTLTLLLTTFTNAQEITPPPGWQRFADAPPESMQQFTVTSRRLTNGPHVRAAFRDVILLVRPATVRVRCDGKNAGLGGIVGPDGWVLTKASLLHGTISCRLVDGRELDARVVGVSRDYDVAMLKIDAKRLAALKIAELPVPPVGSWVATVGMRRDPLAVGVVSVAPREIPSRAGILGIQLDADTQNPRVVRVFPHTGAANAGVQVNDEIIDVDGTLTATREALIQLIQGYNPGDEVAIQVKRGERTITLQAHLTGDLPGMPVTRDEFQNNLGGSLSQRRYGFPSAFQHDSVIQASECGGPLVNLEGDVVGINIARSGRTETYSLTATSITKLLYELMSGNLPLEEEPALEEIKQQASPVPADTP